MHTGGGSRAHSDLLSLLEGGSRVHSDPLSMLEWGPGPIVTCCPCWRGVHGPQ